MSLAMKKIASTCKLYYKFIKNLLFYNILYILIDNISLFSRTTEVQGTKKEDCCSGNWR